MLLENNESGFDHAHKVKYGLGKKGGADLVGAVCMTVEKDGIKFTFGRFFALEVKTGKATTTKDQRMWAGKVRRYGCFYAVVRSVADALAAVERCRGGEYE